MSFSANLFERVGLSRGYRYAVQLRREIEDYLDYTLVPFEADKGRGYYIHRFEDDQRLNWRALRFEAGLEAIPVAGTSHRRQALQDDAFAPGQPISLVPEPDNPNDPNAVGVWDGARRQQVGYLPAEHAARIVTKLSNGGVDRSIAMCEKRKNGERVGMRILVISQGARVGIKAFGKLAKKSAARKTVKKARSDQCSVSPEASSLRRRGVATPAND